nr:hypothetical protein [Tanacetum cinerariifolium]
MAENRIGAEVVHGAEECHRYSKEFLAELGFPSGIFPLKDPLECGRVRETGFVWIKQKAPYEHLLKGVNTRASYASEITAYIEKNKMKKLTGVKTKQLFMWVPISEISMENANSSKMYVKTAVGVGKSYPTTAFMSDEEKKKYLALSK